MTFEEYAVKNIGEMRNREPSAQNMRDIALLELWLVSKDVEGKVAPEIATPQSAKETKDILPSYSIYVETKRKFQLKEATQEKLIYTLKSLSEELKELIKSIYRNTETQEERNIIKDILNQNDI